MDESTVLLVPQKDLDLAKSRLALSTFRRRELAVTMLRRSLVAAASGRVAAVVVVLDNAADEGEVADLDVLPFHSGPLGLNPSLVAAADAVRSRWGDVPVAVMPSDLPMVTGPLLDRSLARAAEHERAFVPDRSGEGTTLLFARAGARLDPAYGPRSAHTHHAQGAFRLDQDDLALLRHDVDEVMDLAGATLHLQASERRDEQHEAS